jgi:hypothetical protein
MDWPDETVISKGADAKSGEEGKGGWLLEGR